MKCAIGFKKDNDVIFYTLHCNVLAYIIDTLLVNDTPERVKNLFIENTLNLDKFGYKDFIKSEFDEKFLWNGKNWNMFDSRRGFLELKPKPNITTPIDFSLTYQDGKYTINTITGKFEIEQLSDLENIIRLLSK